MTDVQGRWVVFISHKWCNRDVAVTRKIIEALGKLNIVANSLIVDPVIPTHSITGTERARIDEADCFAVLWTQEAARSPGVQREIERARSSGKEVVLLRWFDTALPRWYDSDKAYIRIDSNMVLPCDANATPNFPGLIDRVFGFDDFGQAVASQIVSFLKTNERRRAEPMSRAASLPSTPRAPTAGAAGRSEVKFEEELEVEATGHNEIHAALPKGTRVTGLVRETSGLPFDFYVMDQRNFADFCNDRSGSEILSEEDVVAFQVRITIPRDGVWYFVADTYGKQADRTVRFDLRASVPERET